MNLALFDLDNTLIAGDSDYEWGAFLCDHNLVDVADQAKKNAEFMRDYDAGQLNIHAFLQFQLAPLTRFSRRELAQWHQLFMQERITPLLLPAAQALVKRHRDAGDLCALVSATNTFVTAPIARRFGIEHLVCTVAAQDAVSGRFSGQARGTPSFQAGKITRVEEWLENQGLWWGSFEQSYFYSDSANDIPLLEKVSTPCAVNPDPRLQATANERGWQILDLRH